MCIRDRNRCRRLRNIRQSNKGLRGGDTPLPKHVEEKLWDVGAGKAVPLRDGVDDLGPEAGHSSVAVEDVMDELFRNVTRYNPGFERETISRAFQLASSMHGDQLRASGESFILHPLGTALICAELRLDSATITAALLHDVVEDTDVGLDLIEEEFGEEVALLVDGVTKLTKMTFKSVEEQQAENYRKMIIAMAKDIRVILIKLADRLHNMRTLCYLGKEKQIQKAKETLEIYAPLAHRLGIESMRWELEDLAFSTLHPRKYAEIEKMVSQRRADREEYIEEARNYLSKELGKVKIKSEIVGRAKHFYSIYDMNETAQFGIAAHWTYKERSEDGQSSETEKLQWLRQMMEWQSEAKDASEFMESLRVDLFHDEVYVFTPNGEVKSLPADSTPVDFAYQIHTDVGNRCVGAKANGRIVPLTYPLQSGDIIEILTSKTPQGPSRDWLNFVQSSKARNKIRQWFKRERREDSEHLGKESLM